LAPEGGNLTSLRRGGDEQNMPRAAWFRSLRVVVRFGDSPYVMPRERNRPISQRMTRLWSSLIFCVLFLCSPGMVHAARASPWAQFADPVFMRLEHRDAPPIVLSITSDRSGFIWLGTEGGLVRYDGYEFRMFSANAQDPHALPNDWVNTMLAASDGGLWIGTGSGGLVRFDATTETFRAWPPDPRGLSGPRSSAILALLSRPSGNLLVGGDGGLDRFDPHSGVFTPMQVAGGAAGQPTIYSLLTDAAGTLWVGTARGLYYRAKTRRHFRRFALGPNAAPSVHSLYQDGAGRLWVGGENALYAIDASRSKVRTFVSSPDDPRTLAPGAVMTLLEVRPGVLWAGGYGGLSVIDTATNRVHRVEGDSDFAGGFQGGRIFTLYRDRSGLVWVGGDAGTSLHNPRTSGLHVVSATKLGLGPSGVNGARSVALSDGRLWAGGNLGRIVALDSRNGTTTSLTVPDRLPVRQLTAAAGGGLWLTAGFRALCLLDVTHFRVRCPAGPPRFDTEPAFEALDTASSLYLGTYNDGLFVRHKATGQITQYRRGQAPDMLSNGIVSSLLLDREGRLWVGTYGGLDVIDARGRVVKRYVSKPGEANSIGSGLITAIFEDRNGRIWACANGGPLNVLVPQRDGSMRVVRLTRANGLPSENVDAIGQDPQGRIWAATDAGVAVFDVGSFHARALGFIDGVGESGYWADAVAQDKDGTLIFGGADGLTVIAPGASSPWTYAPPLVVTELTIGGHRIPAGAVNQGKAVELPAGARAFSAAFAALDYSSPASIQYEYQLDGFDRDWIRADPEHRVAAYTNLPAGTYTLRVRATNRLGVWSTHSLALRITAPAQWYETWWFKALLLLSALAAMFGATQLRTAVLRRRQRQLEGVIAARTQELSVANAALSIANKALMEASLTDPLTGLRNRRFLLEHIEDDVAMCVRPYEDWLRGGGAGTAPDGDLIFFLVDIDHFKAVNDSFGHAAGDRVLVQMRERLEEVFRHSDYVLRWGGEEFLAVARGSRRGDAPEIAERLRRAVAGRPFRLEGDDFLAKTASVGFASFPFSQTKPRAVNWSQVIELADQALYMAKRAGRNRWFGLTASPDTDVDVLAAGLASAPEDVVRRARLQVVSEDDTPSGAATERIERCAGRNRGEDAGWSAV
jgi:diguanylate cyclase (GGDEF)-like protein